jgi:hypothetical protein
MTINLGVEALLETELKRALAKDGTRRPLGS